MKKLLFIILIASSTILNATITVTNVNTTIATDPTSSYQIDLDNDATPDFSIDAYRLSGDTNQIILKMLHGNAETVPLGAATVNVVDAKNFGDNFGSWWQSYDSYIYHIPEFMSMDNAGYKYIGLRLFKNGNYYYGWVQVRVYTQPTKGFIDIVDYAFEDYANTLVTAGQTVSAPNGIKEMNSSALNIFPNPVNNIFTIDSSIDIDVINLYSVTGTLIKRINVVSNNRIDVSDVEPGIYFVEMITDNQKVVKKIIKG